MRIYWCSIILKAYFAVIIFLLELSSPLAFTFDATPFQRAVKLSRESKFGTYEVAVFLKPYLSPFFSTRGDLIWFIWLFVLLFSSLVSDDYDALIFYLAGGEAVSMTLLSSLVFEDTFDLVVNFDSFDCVTSL